MTQSEQRIGNIDTAKGILIILVVIGHVLNFNTPATAAIKTWLCSFHIPAFFIISGLLINPEKWRQQSFSTFAKHKAYSLLIPYIFFEVAAGIFQMILFGVDAVNPVGIFCGMLTLHCNQGADWFLPTLFVAEVIMWLFIRFNWYRYNYIAVLLFLGIGFWIPEPSYLVGVLRRICIAVAFLMIGVLLKRVLTHTDKNRAFVFGGGTLVISYLNGCVDLSMRQFHNPALYLLGAVLGTYFILNMSEKMDSKWIRYAGRNSLIIMGTHQSVIVVFNQIFQTNNYGILIQAVVLFSIGLVEVAIIPIIIKCVPFLVDRKD